MLLLSTLYDIIFDENPTVTSLLTLVSALAISWGIFFQIFGAILRPLVYGKPWLIATAIRDYERGGKELNEAMGVPLTKEEHVELFMDRWPWLQGIMVQHGVGGLLCVPSIMDIGDPQVASSLACLGILSEMGWEIEDMVSWLAKRFFLPDGKFKVPNAMLLILAIHHSMTTVLGVPLVLAFRDLKTLHWICFDLQTASIVAMAVTEYTKLLDVSKPNQLRQFQVLTFVALAVMIWARGFHWVYLVGNFILTWYQQEAWTFLVLGTIMCTVFTYFNWIFCIQPFYGRFRKFIKASAEYQALPAKERRASFPQLQAAADDVVYHHSTKDEIAALFLNRKVSRRSTMPPSLVLLQNKRKSLGSNRRSSVSDLSSILSRND